MKRPAHFILRHPAGRLTAIIVWLALGVAVWWFVSNQSGSDVAVPADEVASSAAAPPSANEGAGFAAPQTANAPTFEPAPTVPSPPPSGCYWKNREGTPYALAYPPTEQAPTLDGKPLVGYAVVWQFSQDEIVIRRHEEYYRLSQWPIAIYLADESANRVLLEIQGLYEKDGERISGETVEQTCSSGEPLQGP